VIEGFSPGLPRFQIVDLDASLPQVDFLDFMQDAGVDVVLRAKRFGRACDQRLGR
jgi:hypothetical protein